MLTTNLRTSKTNSPLTAHSASSSSKQKRRRQRRARYVASPPYLDQRPGNLGYGSNSGQQTGGAPARSRKPAPRKRSRQVNVVRHESAPLEQHRHPAKTQRSTQRLARKTKSRCRRLQRLSTLAPLTLFARFSCTVSLGLIRCRAGGRRNTVLVGCRNTRLTPSSASSSANRRSVIRWRARLFSLHYTFCRATESGLVQHSAGLVAFVLREDV